MDNGSICFSNGDEAWKKQLGSKERNLQAKDIEKILLEKDELIALLEKLILEKKTTISALENQNHELLQKMHAIESTSKKLTERGETDKQVVNDLLGRSDREKSLLSTLPKPKWDGERLALENQVSNMHQEFKLLKSEKSVKTFSNSLKGISFIPYLAQEVNNGGMINIQRNNLAVPEEHITIYGTAKVFEGRLDGEPYLSNTISEESAYIILESPLKNMSKEQLISHYIRVVAAMRRDKEILLAEKTEEIYRLKRNILKEKGNESEIRILRRTLNDVTRKLDEVMKDNEKLVVSRRFEDKNSGMISALQDNLQAENKRMVELLRAKEREFKAPYDSKELENSSRESYLLNQIEELENEMEEIKVKNRIEIDMLIDCLEEIIKEKAVALNMALKECLELRKQKHSLEELMYDKERGLSLVLMEKEDQKQKIVLMEKLIEQKENKHKELQGLLQKSLKECKELQRKNVYMETLALENERALDSAKREQDELKKQVVLLEEAVEESRHCVDVTFRDLEETRKEKLMLEDAVQERENTLGNIMEEEEGKRTELEGIITKKNCALTSFQREIEKKIKETLVIKESFEQNKVAMEWALMCIKEEEQKKQFFEANVQKLEYSIKSMQVNLQMEQKQSQMELSQNIRNIMDASLKLEDLALEKLHHNSLRLGGAERQLIMLRGLADSFAFRESHYRKMYEIKRSNLQKAEEEVDLLGDEVDSLVNLLEKVYVVLNHYAPILQHYPGILELVKLINKEIMGHGDVKIKL